MIENIQIFQLDEQHKIHHPVNSIEELISLLSNENSFFWVHFKSRKMEDLFKDFLKKLLVSWNVINDVIEPSPYSHYEVFEEQHYGVFHALYHDALQQFQSSPWSFLVSENAFITMDWGCETIALKIEWLLDSRYSWFLVHRDKAFLYEFLNQVLSLGNTILEKRSFNLERLEEELLRGKETQPQQFYALKHEQHQLRRHMNALRVGVQQAIVMQRRGKFPKPLRAYYRDLSDASDELVSMIAQHSEMVGNLWEVHVANMNLKMNETMRMLSLFGTVFIPLTFVASLYGMNFKHMPILNWHEGYYVVLGTMAGIAITLLGYFKSKKWL